MHPHPLLCDLASNPLGLDNAQPQFSWQTTSTQRGAQQSAYQLRAYDNSGVIWDTGQVTSAQSLHIPYGGPALRSRQRYAWQVRVWDETNVVSEWSKPATWEMGLLKPKDWRAKWITPAGDNGLPSPMLRTEFNVSGPVQTARLYLTSLGLYRAHLNGQPVNDWRFTPGWTSYHHHLQYQTYEVTAQLTDGANALGVTLGDGWYRGNLGWVDRRNVYGDTLALLCQLHITYADGREQWVTSDDTWRANTGPIRASDIYMGETYDARLEREGWTRAGYDSADWSPVRNISPTVGRLVAQSGPAVRPIEEIRPKSIGAAPNGETLVDFGQNLVGWVRLRVHGPAGAEITIRHAEVLDAAGNLYTANLRSATQTVRYILRGDESETYEPHFTFQGFRYVAVSGWPADDPLTLDSLTGVVLHSEMASTGAFECSHPLLNQLQHNIRWGQKGNFLDVPTDCPQRDERMGWTGDAQVFSRTAAFNFDVARFFTKWLRDVAADQWPDGAVPHVIPDVLRLPDNRNAGATGWADAAVITPWVMYQCYGNTRILEDQYASMKAWVEYMRGHGPNEFLFGTGFHFGDWLALDHVEPTPSSIGATDRELIGTAFFANSAAIVAHTAKRLGKARDAKRYITLHQKIVRAFQREFLTPSGRLTSNTQTAYTLALQFDLLPEKSRPEAARRLVTDIQARKNHLSTGFLGASYLPHVLSRFGYLDVAYALLMQESYPSWLYPVTQGATTIWERWDGRRPDGTFQNPGMNSFNHYAYGAIGDWLYRVVAGLDIDFTRPAQQRAIIKPCLGGGLTHAQAALDTLLGRYSVAWRLEPGHLSVSVVIPANGTAEVHLPSAQLPGITESGVPLLQAPGCATARQADAEVLVAVGAGEYHFVCATSG